MIKKGIILSLTLFMSFSFNGCRNNNDWGIPLVRVDEIIYLANPSNIDLNAVGGYIYYPGGSRGLLIYRFSQDEFRAYDRHGTYQPSQPCDPVYVDNSGIIIKDPCSTSEWVLIDGSVAVGPAGLNLKQYQTFYDGSSVHVFN